MSNHKNLEDVIKAQSELAASLREKRAKADAEAAAAQKDEENRVRELERLVTEQVAEVRKVVDGYVSEFCTVLREGNLDPKTEAPAASYKDHDLDIKGLAQLNYIQPSTADQKRPSRVLIRFGWGPFSKDRADVLTLWIHGSVVGKMIPQMIEFKRVDVPTIKWGIKTIMEHLE